MTSINSDTSNSFQLVEATIDELHAAIRSGDTTCVAVVEEYIARARAYNGVSSLLVTEDGAPVSPATGAVRAQSPIEFPTETVNASDVLPDLDKYQGPPLEFGRMEATASDPSVSQQFGMIVGIPNAGQLNALATLNIRGERSVTCRGDYDRHPSLGPLPTGAPPVCEHFRHFPDALERAAELDAAYGRNPDLEAMPMYGVVFSFKDPFDTRDMRSTGGGDAAYDIDFPGPRPHPRRAVAEQRGHHLRQGGQHRVQRSRRRPRRAAHSRQGVAVGAGLPAQHLGRQPVQRLRHLPRRLPRFQLRLGGVGQRQSGDGQPGRGDPRLDPWPLQPQLRGPHPASQGDDRLRRRRNRGRYLLRPYRHPRPASG